MNNIRTCCAHCLFRENDSNGNQNGCQLGRLAKFSERGEAVQENDYYVISRFCNACRAEGFTKESILQEVEISCTFIVDGTEKEYWHILKNLIRQTVKPKRVFVVFRDIFDKSKYDEYQNLYNNNEIQLVFKKYFDNKTFPNMVDDVVLKCNTQYYSPINDLVPEDFIKKYNSIINEDLKPLNANLTDNYFNSFISCYLHKVLGGNKEVLITEKIRRLAEEKSEKERATIT